MPRAWASPEPQSSFQNVALLLSMSSCDITPTSNLPPLTPTRRSRGVTALSYVLLHFLFSPTIWRSWGKAWEDIYTDIYVCATRTFSLVVYKTRVTTSLF